MNITKTLHDAELTIALEGRLDSTTAPDLECEVRACLADITFLIFDLEQLTYISSAGLRILLSSQRNMNPQGSMVVRNVRPEIMEIFNISGFSDILTIE